MSKIENSNQLRKEILRLQVELDKKEENLKAKFKEVRDDFKPENIAIRALSNVTGINFVKGDFLKSGIMATISIIVHRLITKQESVLEKKIFSWAENFIDRLKDFKSKKE
ncbi:MAG: hypothetical protein IPP27_11060 [Bacteroidetes bacterium]|jgi:hypothetical protein|nr:hypothetical protein [Bacteroidota bacterium]MBP6426146.1 hypothetical protein [Bacteroidia bacterium]MBK8364162.1 hypothetical protein [Bacteroidota bacterium]MBK9413518.1 hypothetical protein [Bacteroidota bacterium]MBL0032681.1 hypothetical protein [Bacteroidota bacterium]